MRCAIYTRKSTEDGLDQEFNSLDAQYEACKAYILSQRHEGWRLVDARYDDGGFSGGTMERPGLKRLLADVAAGSVDVIVLYKIDRLTRSLADFAKIVEVLDGAGASFVSITQSFNTTTSMGRLTLNVLLSFAQFEREVTGERIRDKIAASKRKGIWMGGPVPLGYDVRDRRLVVNEAEAETVRHIMRRYCELDSVNDLAEELRLEGRVTKLQVRASGPHRGGIPFKRGTLYHLLKNRTYLGEIVHKGTSFPGEHDAIVPAELWDRVQATLVERSASARTRTRAKRPSLLAGLLFDGLGRRMVPSHSTSGPRQYRYYVTRPDLLNGTPAWRTGAHDIESIVCTKLAGLLSDRAQIRELADGAAPDARQIQEALDASAAFVHSLREGPLVERTGHLQSLLHRVTLGEDQLCIDIDRAGLVRAIGLAPELPDGPTEVITLTCETARVRRGHELRLMIPGAAASGDQPLERDEKLVRLLAEAHAARLHVDKSPEKPLVKIATEEKRCRTRLGRLYAIGCLAPDIVTAVVEGRQPRALSRRALFAAELPLEWERQRELFGFVAC
jgi:DNA invertase Pin-like site-specific DNA recombinase